MLELVDRVYPRQKLGWWVSNGENHKTIADMCRDYRWDKDTFGWGVESTTKGVIEMNIKAGNYCLCAVDEMDPEENEFGTVSP